MKNVNKYALLGLLTIKPMTGYVMKKWVDGTLNHFWRVSYGQIYPALKQFLEDEMVVFTEIENDKGAMTKEYAITDKGRQELREWLLNDEKLVPYRDEDLLKFYFSNELTIDETKEMIMKNLVRHKTMLETYSIMMAGMDKVQKPTRQQMIDRMSLRRGVLQVEAEYQWEQEMMKVLDRY